jgi:hypothetical protein
VNYVERAVSYFAQGIIGFAWIKQCGCCVDRVFCSQNVFEALLQRVGNAFGIFLKVLRGRQSLKRGIIWYGDLKLRNIRPNIDKIIFRNKITVFSLIVALCLYFSINFRTRNFMAKMHFVSFYS